MERIIAAADPCRDGGGNLIRANEMRRIAALAETDAVLMPHHLSPDIVASRRTIPASERTLDPNEIVVSLDQPLGAATEHLERVMIPYGLRHCDGRVEEAARRLGLAEGTVSEAHASRP